MVSESSTTTLVSESFRKRVYVWKALAHLSGQKRLHRDITIKRDHSCEHFDKVATTVTTRTSLTTLPGAAARKLTNSQIGIVMTGQNFIDTQ